MEFYTGKADENLIKDTDWLESIVIHVVSILYNTREIIYTHVFKLYFITICLFMVSVIYYSGPRSNIRNRGLSPYLRIGFFTSSVLTVSLIYMSFFLGIIDLFYNGFSFGLPMMLASFKSIAMMFMSVVFTFFLGQVVKISIMDCAFNCTFFTLSLVNILFVVSESDDVFSFARLFSLLWLLQSSFTFGNDLFEVIYPSHLRNRHYF